MKQSKKLIDYMASGNRKTKLQTALEKFSKEHGACRIEEGVHKKKGPVLYLVVEPESKEDITEFYILNKKDYTIGKKICGCIGAPEDKKLNSRCIQHSGHNTDHKGIGFCNFHRKHEHWENKFKRKYLSSYLFGSKKGKQPVYLSLLESFERQPVNAITEMEDIYRLVKSMLAAKLGTFAEVAVDGGKPEEVNLYLEPDGDGAVLAFVRELRNLLKDLHMMQREVLISPIEMFKWLDEVKLGLQNKIGAEQANEVLYILVNTKGILNKTELPEGTIIDNGFLAKEDSLLKALPLGYNLNADDADWEDVT